MQEVKYDFIPNYYPILCDPPEKNNNIFPKYLMF